MSDGEGIFLTTIKDIAKKAGFSIATVSRVLNNDDNLSVTDSTREKVFQVANQLGYRKKSVQPIIKNIAFLYWLTDKEELEDVYFKTMREEVEKYAKLLNVELTTYKISKGIEQIPKDIEGFIAIGGFSKDELNYLSKITLNGVFIDSTPNPNYFDSVRPDLATITMNAIDYFIAKGHNQIGFIGGTYHDPDTDMEKMDLRERKFREYMREKDLLNEQFIYCNPGFSVNNGYQLMNKAIDQLGEDLPTAFLVAADPIAIGCLQALNEQQIVIPNRVSVIGINNVNVTKYVSPPLTTFHIDIPELSKNAVELLIDRITTNRKYVKTVCISAKLIERKSVNKI